MILLVILSLIFFFLYWLDKFFLNHWTRQGIPQGRPKTLFGDFKKVFLHTESIADVTQQIYLQSKPHRIYGMYLSYRPMLFVNDPRIIRDIMQKDSMFFPDRGVHANGNFDPLTEQLFFQGGQTWKTLRAKLTPAFSSLKLKGMLPIVAQNCKILQNFIDKRIDQGVNVLEFRDLIARVNTNIISSVAFGIEVDTVFDSKHVMRQMGVKVFEPNLVAGLRFFTAFFTPKINEFFRFKFVSNEVETFFKSIIEDNVAFREKNEYQRNDLLNTLIQLKNDGFAIDDDKQGIRKLSLSEVCAQSFGFYLGGFETTSTTVSFCLRELANNLEMQKKAQAEMDQHFKVSEDVGEMYEMLKKLKYLECCMLETLRKYPPLPVLNRKCVSDYQVADSDFVIKEGTQLLIPIFGLQRDPEIYESPEKFKPERFMNRPTGSDAEGTYFLPFGHGQRICIGHRMGRQNTTFQLAMLLSKFEFESNSTSEMEVTFNPNQLFLQPTRNIHLGVKKRIL